MDKKIGFCMFVCLLLVISFVPGCVEREGVPKAPRPATPRDTLVVGTIRDPVELDPARAYDTASGAVITQIFDTLVGYKEGSTELEPRLAERWEVSPDGTQYTFYLRKGVKFHDGTPFNAEAMYFSLKRVLDLNEKPAVVIRDFIKGGSAYTNPEDPNYHNPEILGLEVVDEYTLRITTEYPFAPFLSVLTHTVASAVSPAAVEKYGDEFFRNPVGTGPFKFVSWEKGVEVRLEANQEYFRGPPKVRRVIFKVIPEPSVLKIEIQKGTIDITGTMFGLRPEDVKELKERPGIKTEEKAALTITYIGFVTDRKPFNDKRVRQAFAYALDYDALINKILEGVGARFVGPIPPNLWGYNPDVPLYEQDLEKAAKLLDEAGYPADETGHRFRTTIWYNSDNTTRRDISVLLQSNLKEIGVDLEIKALEWGTYLDYLYGEERKIDTMFIIGWAPDYVDPDNYVYPLLYSGSHPPNGSNNTYYSNPRVDELTLEARRESDHARREQLYKEIVKIVAEDSPWIFLYAMIDVAVTRENVHNFHVYPQHYIDFYPVYKT